MPYYDLTLGGIALPTAEQDFSEQLGSDFELVGAVPMPGAPRPASMYNINIPIYGDPQESDPFATGNTKRAQVRALLQNAETRFEGIQLAAAFDATINGWIVIGTAELAYGVGGPTFADYMLRISGAALIPAQQALLAHRVLVQDRRSTSVPLDPRWRAFRSEPAKGAIRSRHYLPVGATDVFGQTDPQIPETGTYETLWGEAPYVENRKHGELLTFELPWEDVGKGDVRLFEPGETIATEHEDLLDPERVGWRRIYGPLWPRLDDVPVLENGLCRVRHLGEGKFVVEKISRGRYEEAHSFALHHPRLVSASVVSWSTERGLVKATFAGASSRVDVQIGLQRGWPGPTVDIYHVGERSRKMTVEGDAHTEEIGDWEHARFGVGIQEALATSRSTRQLLVR